MIRALLALEARISAPVPAAPMALARTLFGALFVLAWALTASRAEIMWGPEGVARALFRTTHHWTEEAWPYLLAGIFVGGTLFSVGLLTRWAGALLVGCHLGMVQGFHEWTWGWASAMPVLVTYVVLSDAGKAWSLDAWRTGGRTKQALVGVARIPGWPWRLLVWNVAMIYFAAGWHRIDDSSWLDGDIVWEAVVCSLWSRWVWVDWNAVKGLLRFGAYAAETLEVGGAILLLVPRIRPWWALGCILLHVGLEATSSVGWWQWGMTIALTALLWPGVSERILRAIWRVPPAG